jgi:hypothetical protein
LLGGIEAWRSLDRDRCRESGGRESFGRRGSPDEITEMLEMLEILERRDSRHKVT